MKRKRQARHDQCLKEQGNSSSTKSFRSNITGKLQTFFNGFVSELQSISDDKRQDVALLFSSKYKEANCADESSSFVKSSFPNLASSSDSTKALQNFIDSAKSRISELLREKQENKNSSGNNLLKSFQSSQSQAKSFSIDPLEIQINLKFQSLLFKAFDTKKANHVTEKQEITTSKNIIFEKDWQDLSRMLQDFNQSAKKKLRACLTKDKNSESLNGSVTIQSCPVKESQSSHNSQSSIIVNQRKCQNKHPKPVNLQNSSTHLRAKGSCKLSKENAKTLKMDSFSENTDSSSSPRNPFDEGCMLLLSDAEKCPSYVDLNLSSESDEREDVTESPQYPLQKSESEDEVIVLGEKSKTYQEVTLEEDDEGLVRESVVEKVLQKCPKKEKYAEEPVFNCPICDKSYRAPSLLQFHVKMHASENPPSKASDLYPNSNSTSEDESCSPEKPMNLSQRVRKEKESAKGISKISSIKKNRREKYKRRRNRETSKSSL